MRGLWRAVSDYPFDERGQGPQVVVSFVRDGARTTRTAYATRNSEGLRWHCSSDEIPSGSIPDIWLDETGLASVNCQDYVAAVARKVEEMTAKYRDISQKESRH